MTLSRKIKNKLINYYRWIFLGDRFLPEVQRWFKEQGDGNLRLDYKLDNDSVVFDVGGYEGGWSEQVYDKFKPSIFIFEPVPEYAKSIKAKFSNKPKIKTYDYGLSNRDSKLNIYLNDDNSSFHISKTGKVVIADVKAVTPKLLEELGVNKIDLMKVNIEGAEYELLDYMIENGTFDKVDNLQVQFHNFVPDAIKKRNSIRAKLSITHTETWCYEFVWENWKRNV